MNKTSAETRVFSIFSRKRQGWWTKLLRMLLRPLEVLTGLSRCEAIYRRIDPQSNPGEFMRQALAELNIQGVCRDRDVLKIPASGSCVVIANHPFGMVEGMILAEQLLRIRPDVKIMANFLLNRIPQLQDLMISVDPFERAHSAAANVRPIREAIRWVGQGGLLMVFPAGEVSHFSPLRGEIADPPWKMSLATILRHTRSTVVPVFFQGQNSFLFQIAGLIHPLLRTALLARESLKRKDRQIVFKIGNPIPHAWTSRYTDDEKLMEYLRWRTYVMGHPSQGGRLSKLSAALRAKVFCPEPVAGPMPTDVCAREIEKLPAGQMLVRSGSLSVWNADAHQIPHVLSEIGRLREIAFRQAGEGTQKSLDIDRFDTHYLHLFLWNEQTREIVGAYRIGQTDRILDAMGREGLYTNTLFHCQTHFYEKLGPALELGRSFIRPEYQKSYAPLFLLWKGIGAYIASHPHYRALFGPVSISSDYSDLTRRLLATTLLRHRSLQDLAVMVRPRRPVRLGSIRIRGCNKALHDVELDDFREVCAVVSDIEVRLKDVPVLLRHYLNLGGKLLSFNIDRSFSGVMDGLVVMDLLHTDRKTLERYMGAESARQFIAFHSNSVAEKRLSA